MSARSPKVSFALPSVSRECGNPCVPWLNHNLKPSYPCFIAYMTKDFKPSDYCVFGAKHRTANLTAVEKHKIWYNTQQQNRGAIMATAIKAIPTLKGREAFEFLQNAEAVERNCSMPSNPNDHPLCKMAHAILRKAGMLK